MLHHHVRFKYVTRSDGGQERNHFICNLSVTLHISDEQKFVEQGGRGLRLEKSSSPLLSLDSCCGLLSLEQSAAHGAKCNLHPSTTGLALSFKSFLP